MVCMGVSRGVREVRMSTLSKNKKNFWFFYWSYHTIDSRLSQSLNWQKELSACSMNCCLVHRITKVILWLSMPKDIQVHRCLCICVYSISVHRSIEICLYFCVKAYRASVFLILCIGLQSLGYAQIDRRLQLFAGGIILTTFSASAGVQIQLSAA